MLLVPSLLLSLLSAPPAPAANSPCAGRAPCQVVETLEGGLDSRGQPLRVVHLDLGWFAYDDAPEDLGQKLGPQRRAEGTRADGDCSAAEWWLMRPEPPHQLLLAVCNDGYGKAGAGEDRVSVKNGLLTHMRTGGAGQRWRHTRVLRLSTLERVSEAHENFFVGAPDKEDSRTWDFTTLQGERYLGPNVCRDGPSSPLKRTLPYLPLVQMDAAYVSEGWKQVGLGACALEARNLVLGKLKDPKDASLKAVLVAPDTLMLEVRDDVWLKPGGASWLADDHVELWLGRKSPEELTGCGKPELDERLEQWGLRVADGEAFTAYGHPQGALEVERVELRGAGGIEGYRLKLTLPERFPGISVVYSDNDGGKKPERMLATSAVKYSRPETLNIVRRVPRADNTCVVKGKELVVVTTPLPLQGPDFAVLTNDP